MNLPIRWRLTLLYFSFFALAGMFLAVASWLLLERSLTALMLHELDERIDDLQAALASHPPDTNLLRAELLREYRLKDEGKWLQITNSRGEWLYFSARARVADPLPPLPSAPGHLVPFVAAPGHDLRTLSRDLALSGQTYHVSTAISADRSVAILGRFRTDLFLLVPLVIVSSAVVGHFLSRKALDPVGFIVTEVRRINERNLSKRLPLSPARDELSLLSHTLNEMLERIDSAFRSVRLLTANASHELRTPLSLIRARIEIALCFPRAPEYYNAALEDVLSETVRMSALIDNLLALARYDAGAAQTKLSVVDLSSVLSKAAREWAATAERLSLDVQLDGNREPLWVLADSDLVERMLRILVDNACRYTPSGGWVRLEGKVCQDRIIVAVRDNGVGIAEHDLPRIFDRFYRAHEPQHQEQRGSGLGLALARWIAEQHKTTITVDSAPGSGSRFEFSFPQIRP
jgi:heavy metal sensor kinase